MSAIATGQDVPHMAAVSADARRACVTNIGSGTVTALVLEAGAQARRRCDGGGQRPFARLAPGSVLPVGLLVSRDGRTAFVAATMGDRVVQYDMATLSPLRTIEVGGEPDGLGSTTVLHGAPCHACAPYVAPQQGTL